MRRIDINYVWSGNEELYQKRLSYLKSGDLVVVTGAYNGPGSVDQYDPALRANILEIQALGAIPFGYVPAGFGARTLSDFMSDVAVWAVPYGVNRLFIDQWPDNWGSHSIGNIWGMVRAFVPANNPALIVNPGKQIDLTVKLPASAIVVTYEGASVPTWTPKPWEAAICHHAKFPATIKLDLEREGWQYGFVTQGEYADDPGI